MIEPYQALGLVPTMRGIRRREDIGVNLEQSCPTRSIRTSAVGALDASIIASTPFRFSDCSVMLPGGYARVPCRGNGLLLSCRQRSSLGPRASRRRTRLRESR